MRDRVSLSGIADRPVATQKVLVRYSSGGWNATGLMPPELPALPAAFAGIPVDRPRQVRD